MGEKKVTKMIIRGDLQCYRCSKKIKKILCQIPQIQNQVYDEKNNKVTITVVCCSPEKIRDKICVKACGSIESVEIVEEKPPKPNPPTPPKPDPPTPPKPDSPPASLSVALVPDPPKPNPRPTPKPIKPCPMPVLGCPPVFYPIMWCPCYFGCRVPCYHLRLCTNLCPDGCGRPARECTNLCPDGCGRPARDCRSLCPDGCGRPASECMSLCPDGCGRPASECMSLCADGCGRLANECMCPDGCGRPTRECMCPDGCGRLVTECHGSNKGYYVNRCDYLSEENANACTIM